MDANAPAGKATPTEPSVVLACVEPKRPQTNASSEYAAIATAQPIESTMPRPAATASTKPTSMAMRIVPAAILAFQSCQREAGSDSKKPIVPDSRSAANSAPPQTVPAVTESKSAASKPAPRKWTTSAGVAPEVAGSASVAAATRMPEPRTISVRPINPCSRSSFQTIAPITGSPSPSIGPATTSSPVGSRCRSQERA